MGDALGKASLACDGKELFTKRELDADSSDHGSEVLLPWLWGGGKPSDTVLIFDWDDTLLCSSAVNLQQCDAGRLQELEEAVEAILRVAMSLGDTFIVTNGAGTWVQDSSHWFLPKLMPLLSRLGKVVSARAAYEQIWPGQPTLWKKAAFEKVLHERKSSSRFSAGAVNLVVLGDSMAEIEAAQTATLQLGGKSIVKTVKFKDMPSVDELLGQIRTVTQALPDIVDEDSSQSKALVPRPVQPHLGYLHAWASGWQIVGHTAQADTRSHKPLAMAHPGGQPAVQLVPAGQLHQASFQQVPFVTDSGQRTDLSAQTYSHRSSYAVA
jgi:hypothetical protein